MTSIYDELIPKKVLFSIKEIEDIGAIKTNMCKKLIYQNELEIVKIGRKNYISRNELIRYLESNTVPLLNSNNKKIA